MELMKLFLLVFTAFSISSCDSNQNVDAFVLNRVIDGDTIVANDQKIRFWGIDTPERNEPYAQEATDFLQNMLLDGVLTCDHKDIDRYQRLVMQCFINGKDVGSILVSNGLATDFERYSGGFYANEENLAKSKRLGILQ